MTAETLPPPAPLPNKKAGKRRGVVIVAVLLVVMILSYAGYSYSDMMQSEYQASTSAHRAAQAKAFADSGIHFAAAVLSNSDNFTNQLNGNPWNNPQAFQDVAIQGDNGVLGRFSLIAPADPDDPSANPNMPRYGVTDEGGKINPNAVMANDPTGQNLYNMLILLPNMTDDIANSIVAWHGGSYGAQNGGAQSDHYQGQNPSYQSKNGPIDSIDEYLLVRGVTWQLLYGSDSNRNGAQDDGEVNSGSSTATGFDRGWSAYLTVHSREQNYDNHGNPYVNLNNTDLTQLYTAVSQDVSDDMAKFIVLYRQYGPSNAAGKSQSFLGAVVSVVTGGSSSQSSSNTPTGDLGSYQVQYTKSGKTKLTSIWQLVNAQVSVQSTGSNGRSTTTVYASPLNDPSKINDLLPKLFTVATLTQGNEIPPRININTAPSAVLNGLANVSPLTQNDVQNIISTRPKLTSTDQPDPSYQTPAWLFTKLQISLTTLQKLDPFITTRSQVYRVQSVGYFADKGPSVRLEAVIDTNMGRPRILAWRNLSELGKGMNTSNSNNNGGN